MKEQLALPGEIRKSFQEEVTLHLDFDKGREFHQVGGQMGMTDMGDIGAKAWHWKGAAGTGTIYTWLALRVHAGRKREARLEVL